MMTKRLFSIMLMVVFLIPFTIQADTISAPSYQVDVTQPTIGVGLNKVIAANAVEPAGLLRSLSQIKSVDANIKMTPQKTVMILAGQCASCHDNDVNGVSGGDSIGIRPIS